MKQHSLGPRSREWSSSRPWNALLIAESAEAWKKSKADEGTVTVEVELPKHFVNAMSRKRMITREQADSLDTTAIAEAVFRSVEERFFGRIKAVRYA